MAAAIPSTRRLGTTLVNSDPGPKVMTSASRMAARASGQRRRVARDQADAPDAFAAAADASFAEDLGTIRQRGFERHARGSGGINSAGDVEHFGGYFHGLRKIADDLGERREKEISETVPLQSAASLKTVLEQARQQGRILAESDQAVADIAGRKDVEVAAQAAGAAAVVGHGDDGGQIHGDVRGARRGVTFQTSEDGRETMAASDRDDA